MHFNSSFDVLSSADEDSKAIHEYRTRKHYLSHHTELSRKTTEFLMLVLRYRNTYSKSVLLMTSH